MYSVRSDNTSRPAKVYRISFVLSSLKFGGGERVALNLAHAFKAEGYEIDFLLMSKEGEFLNEAQEFFNVIDLECRRTWNLPIRLGWYLFKYQPVALISSFWKLNLCSCLARLFFPAVKLLLWEHSPPSKSSNSVNWLYTISASLFYQLSTCVVAVSSGVFNDVDKLTLGLDNKLRRIFNPILPPASIEVPLRDQCQGRKIIWVGRLDNPKNPGLLIEAFALLPKSLDYRLDFVGDGKLREALEVQCKVLGLQDQICFLGFQSNPYLMMSKSDLLVVSSDSEGLPSVMVEALYSGLRVVSTDCGEGIHDILLNNFYGTIVPKGDKLALSGAIEQELNSPYSKQKQIEGAERFLPKLIGRQFLSALGIPVKPLELIAEITSPKKIMLLTKKLDVASSGGRTMLCKLNYDVLKELYKDRLILHELSQIEFQNKWSILNTFQGHIDGLNESVIDMAIQIIELENVTKVFVDGSNLGEFVNAVKKKLPHVEFITFFHNVESRFFWGAFSESKSIRALAVLIVNFLAERKSVQLSDKLICLSKRDSNLIENIYGRSATHISSIALKDMLLSVNGSYFRNAKEKYVLFVGGDFYANRAGIAWFVKNVMPRLQAKVIIVGRGFEELRPQLELADKVKVVGAVNCLFDWYKNAHFVIAPIFDGSGMKTKVAEALMYGKKIVGTPEAFSGYEEIADIIGWKCTTVDEFVAAFRYAYDQPLKSFDLELRTIYEDRYSFTAARKRISEIVGTLS